MPLRGQERVQRPTGGWAELAAITVTTAAWGQISKQAEQVRLKQPWHKIKKKNHLIDSQHFGGDCAKTAQGLGLGEACFREEKKRKEEI